MAFQNFWFPSQTTGYDTLGGSIRFNIKYDTGAGAANTNVAALLLKMSALDMQFEVSPSNESFRHPSITLTFANLPYDTTNNLFEQYSILNETYEFELFVDLYIDGIIFWKGIIDFDKIKRSDYYLDGSTLKYRNIKIKIYDRLAYFWFNPTLDLADLSFANYDSLTDTIEAIFALIDVASGELEYDSNLGAFTEPSGTSYDYTDLLITFIPTTTLLYSFIKSLIQGLACWIYSWNGKYYFVNRNGGSTKAIDTDYVLEKGIQKIENANPIKYINLTATIDWYNDKTPFGIHSSFANTPHTAIAGDSTVDTNKKLEVDLTSFLDFLCVVYAGATSNYPTDASTPTHGTDSWLRDLGQADPPTFYTTDIECGHYVFYFENGGLVYEPINTVEEFQINFPNMGQTVNTAAIYECIRNPGPVSYEEYIFKVQVLMNAAKDIYDDFFLTSPDVIKVKLRDISEYINLHYKFVLFSNNHRIKGAKIYLDKDIMTLDMHEVT